MFRNTRRTPCNDYLSIIVDRTMYEPDASMTFNGSCTMPTMPVHHGTILELIERGEPLRLDLSAVTAADVSFVQLLVAAKRSSEGQNLSFTITAASDAVTTAFAAAGVPWADVAAVASEA